MVDRTRRFVLPGIQDLNKDQDAALALPENGQHLIVGGPGTGKSVVALLRARRLLNSEIAFRFLVYNRLLATSNRHLSGSDHVRLSTWDTWFRELWRRRFKKQGAPLPLLDAQNGSTYQPIDWNAAARWLDDHANEISPLEHAPAIVIDEGQDMPKAFYDTLVAIGFEDFYVAADQNQQIHPDKCSSRQDLENVLAIDPDATLELKQNYRNTRPIAQLARHFYPDDPASPRPELPAASASAMRPQLWTYGDGTALSLAALAARILQMGDRNPHKLIGIITPNNNIRQKFCRALDAAQPRLDNGKLPIQTYKNGDDASLRFDEGGIMVINAQSCKGLEFDIVILADIDGHQPKLSEVLKPNTVHLVSTGIGRCLRWSTAPRCRRGNLLILRLTPRGFD